LNPTIFVLVLVTFATGTEFYGKAGQGAITFTGPITATLMDSDGIKVMFSDFTFNGLNYGQIGFASSIGCSMEVSTVTLETIKYIATVSGELATATVYLPGKTAPQSVSGVTSWSKVGDAVTAIIPNGTHDITLSYVSASSTIPTSTPSIDLNDVINETINFIDDIFLIILTSIILFYILSQTRLPGRKIVKKVRRMLK
jgi:hypothetical protein